MFQTFEVFKYWFQSKLKSKYVEITSTVAYIVMSIYKIILLLTRQDVQWFAVSNSIEFFVVAVLLYILYKKNGGSKLSFSKKYAVSLLNKSKYFIVSGLMVAVYNSTDKFMLKLMISGAEVAYYTTAVTLANLSPILLNAIIESLTPGILKSFNKDKKEFEEKNIRLYSIVFYISLFVSIFVCLFSKPIILLLYGNSYYSAVPVLSILTWYVMFSYLGVARNTWIISMNKQNKLTYIYFLCAILNIILNYLLIPLYGASGAAFASLITQFSTVFIFPLFIREIRKNTFLMVKGIFYIFKFFKKKNY